MNNHLIAGTAEMFTLYRLCSWGYEPQRVAGQKAFDIWLEVDGRIMRVQVKGASPAPRRTSYKFMICQGTEKRPYKKTQVDLCALVGLAEECVLFIDDFETIITKRFCRDGFTKENERRTWDECLKRFLNTKKMHAL